MIRAGRALALALLLGPGCHSYLRPFERAALPVRSAATLGGERLEADDGNLALRTAPGDIESALGVRLEDLPDGGGVLVLAAWREDSSLLSGDEVVHVALALTATATPHGEESEFGQQLGIEESVAWLLLSLQPAPAPERVRAAPQGHAVRSLADLRGYTACLGWGSLDLVVRRDGREMSIGARVRDAEQPLPLTRHRDEDLDALGIEAIDLAGWPERNRPTHALPDDLLVTRVARGSPAARAGLRALDAIDAGRYGIKSGERYLAIRTSAGPRTIVFAARPPRPVEIWIPFVLSYQSDGERSHLGIGPLDVLFHASSKLDYDADEDAYAATSRWSLGTVIGGGSTVTAGGARSTGGAFLFDGYRLDYAVDWAKSHDD